jgi:hypothetical protein
MKTLRSIYHLIRADYLERTRRYSFLVTLAAVVFMAYAYVPSRDASYITLSVDGARGIYNSAWVGSLVAILVGITMPGLGFFLVKNAIARDTETGVGQIIATTPLRCPAYILGKWLSNLSVLAVMIAVMALSTVVLQFVLGEDRHINLLTLLLPLVWIVLPTLALVAAVAILFETIGWLSGGFGNIVYFFTCTVVTMASFLPVMMGMGGAAFGDIFGVSLPLSTMLKATAAAFPSLDAGNTSIGPVPNFLASAPLQTFVWTGLQWTPFEIMARLRWIGVAFIIVLLATMFFTRFDTSRMRLRKIKASPASVTPLPSEQAAPAKNSEMRLTPLAPEMRRFSFWRLVKAELLLIRKGIRKQWLLGALILFAAGLFVSPEIARLYILPITWLWPILIWSALGGRESQYHTGELVFSAAYPLQRQLPATWLGGVLVTALTGSGAAINFLRAGDSMSLLTWLIAVLFIPSLAVALAAWSGSSKAFEVMYMAVWYFGPMNHIIPTLDFLNVSIEIKLLYLAAAVALLCTAFIGRKRQLQT